MSLVAGLRLVLVDTMIVIEALRTACWNAITGGRRIVTVETCAGELRSGGEWLPGYIPVGQDELARATVRPLPPAAGAELRLRYPEADGMHDGERDLCALALSLAEEFQLCSCDKAAVRAAHALGWIERVISLEALADSVGREPRPPLKVQYTEARLAEWRTSLLLHGTI